MAGKFDFSIHFGKMLDISHLYFMCAPKNVQMEYISYLLPNWNFNNTEYYCNSVLNWYLTYFFPFSRFPLYITSLVFYDMKLAYVVIIINQKINLINYKFFFFDCSMEIKGLARHFHTLFCCDSEMILAFHLEALHSSLQW